MKNRKTDEMTSLQVILANYLLERAVSSVKDFFYWIGMYKDIQAKLPDQPEPANARTVIVRRGEDDEYIVEDLALMLPYVGNDPAAYVGQLLDEGEELVRVYTDTLDDDEDTEILVLKFKRSED